ncbi:carbon storage regulator [Anaerosporomusa subterranea]|uniref:Translational regulator CsrA n=1 Tax=Anaerosporomusa subterranea TaxID=1794912 RepID=A0A154BR94_ANASB|nr:carbon storage regulator CsrA [Anaerosporomusa subterranea]KYZ76487.1 carbon storage regulator [Anaerosporomusa subterranea]
MLALTRKPGERIVIGNDIVLTVVEVKGETVRLAIDAPRRVSIFRGEIYDSIVQENRKAAMPMAEGRDLLRNLKGNIAKRNADKSDK